MTLLKGSRVEGVCYIAQQLIQKKIYWALEPKLWEKISHFLKSSSGDIYGNDYFKNAVLALAESKYEEMPPNEWENIMKNFLKQSYYGDLDRMIQLRNLTRQSNPEQLGMLMLQEHNIITVIRRFMYVKRVVLTKSNRFQQNLNYQDS